MHLYASFYHLPVHRLTSRPTDRSAGAPLVGSMCMLARTVINGFHCCRGYKKSSHFVSPFVCCRLMMLLNVGVPTSAIQLIVCVIPIDVFDRSDRLCEWLCWVRSTTRRCDLSGHSRLQILSGKPGAIMRSHRAVSCFASKPDEWIR